MLSCHHIITAALQEDTAKLIIKRIMAKSSDHVAHQTSSLKHKSSLNCFTYTTVRVEYNIKMVKFGFKAEWVCICSICSHCLKSCDEFTDISLTYTKNT